MVDLAMPAGLSATQAGSSFPASRGFRTRAFQAAATRRAPARAGVSQPMLDHQLRFARYKPHDLLVNINGTIAGERLGKGDTVAGGFRCAPPASANL